MSQQNIDFGTFPDDPDADAIRTAFQKVQQNFDEIYDSTANAAVLSVNRSQGAGITVNGPTGNVIVSANIASIQISSVTLKVGTSPNPTTNTASYTNFSQTLYVEIPDNLSIGNITANGFISATGNLTVANANLGNLATANFFSGSGNNLSNIQGANVTGAVGSANTAGTVTTNAQPNITSVGTLTSLVVSGNITPTANITYDLGNNTNRFKDIYLANSTIYLGSATVQANATTLTLTNPLGGQIVVSGNSISSSNAIVNGTSNIVVGLDSNVTISVAGNANVFTVTGTGANVNGSINSLDANLGNAVTANYFIGSGANLTNIPSGNVSGQVGNALVAGTVYTAAQPNITSLGTVTSLSISGNANIGNVGTGLITATGNITGANLVTGGTLSVTGDANVGNIGANNGVFTSIAGTLTTAAQPNVTSTGTLASLSVSGNANISNIGTGLITSTGNITGANLITGGIVSATGNIAGGNISTTGLISATGNITGGDLITGGFVSAIGNITGGNLTATGGLSVSSNANVLNIGGNNAVFTTLTGTLSTASQPNVTGLGTLSNLSVSGNATITNLSVTGNLNAGDITVGAIANGNSNVDITNTNGNVTISVDGVANIATFTSTGANVTGNITAGNANLGNAANANYFIGNLYGTANTATTANTVTTNAQPNITSLGNLANLTVVGNSNLGNVGNVYIGGGAPSNTYLTTDGSGNLSWGPINSFLPGGVNTSVLYNDAGSYGGDANFTFDKSTRILSVNGNVTAGNITGTLTTNAQPNITSVGTLTSLTLGGNLNSNANIVLNNSNANIITDGSIFANTGTVSGNLLTGTLTTNAQPNITSIGTLTSLSISGTLTAGNLATAGTLSVGGNANVGNIGASDGIFTNVSGNGSALTAITGANVTGTVANATFATSAGSATTAGTVTTAAQPNITSTGTLTSLIVTGNIGAGNVSATTFTGALSGAATSATTAGTVTTAAQPNITSLGTLSSLSVSGNANVGNIGANNGVFTNVSGNGSALTAITGANVTGNVGNALNAYAVAGANVSGAVAFATTANAVAGSNVSGAVSFATTANAVAGSNVSGAVSFATTANAVAGANVSGEVSFAATANSVAGANVSGQVGNALVAGTVYTGAQGNITAVGTLTSISVSGNANIGNIGTGGLITATGNITGGNLITGGLLTVTGNIQAANVIATTYNITGVATGISAAGSSQGDATALTKAFNVVSTVSGGQGVVLPTAVAGMRITVVNTSGATLLVYPASGGAINALATNAGYSLPTLGRLDYIATSTSQWYAMGAIYV